MKYKIKYRLRMFELLEEEDGETRRFGKGYITNDMKLSKTRKSAAVLTRKELEQLYTQEEIYLLEHKIHTSLDLEQECEELDTIFDKIKAIKKENFKEGVKTHITIDGLDGEVITYKAMKEHKLLLPVKLANGDYKIKNTHVVMDGQESKQLDFVLEGKGHKAFGGGVKPDMAKLNLTDKIRKEYNYDDPFKHD